MQQQELQMVMRLPLLGVLLLVAMMHCATGLTRRR
jgi:hypothetical protein